jgi:hypothetical protein
MQSKDDNGTLNPGPLAQTDHRRYAFEKYSLSLLKHRFEIMSRVALSEAWDRAPTSRLPARRAYRAYSSERGQGGL